MENTNSRYVKGVKMIIAGIDCSMNGTGIYKFKLDDNLEIIEKDYLAFTTVKKHSSNNILYYNNKKQFKDYLEKNKWMYDGIFKFINNAEYVAIEDYAFGAKGRVFNIAEFTGGLKLKLYENDYKTRLYDIGSIKMFATTNGNSQKDVMQEYFEKEKDIPNLSNLPDGKSPKADVIDAYFIAKLLQTEMKLRYGIVTLKELSLTEIRVFNRVTKANPVNILARDFLTK